MYSEDAIMLAHFSSERAAKLLYAAHWAEGSHNESYLKSQAIEALEQAAKALGFKLVSTEQEKEKEAA
jgi:hypothetical protein